MSIRTQPAAAPLEILIAEDSTTQAEQLKYLLELHGYRVHAREDGREALTWLASQHPALVITDVNMPWLNGYDLCRKIKADQRLQDIPVILLTSLSNAMDVLEGLACGADSFITKPYSEDYLLARVEQTLADAAVPHSRASIKVEIPIPGRSGVITADPQRMVSLLISTYEAAIFRNTELVQTQEAVRTLNEHLEDLVEDRTAALSAEIATREKAEGRIRYLAGVLENVSDGIASTDLNGNIQSWNAGAEALFGYRAEEVVGRRYAGIVANDTLDQSEPNARQRVAETGRWTGEVRARRKDGSAIYVLVAGAVLKDGSGAVTGFSAVLHDITERRQRERELQAFAAVSTALREADTQAEMLPIILDQVMGLLEASAAALAMRDPATDDLVIALGQGEMAGLAGRRQPAGAGLGGQALATGQPYVTEDLAADPHFYDLNWLSEARAAACVPLVTNRQVLGVLWAVRAARFTEVEVRVFSAIAGIAASAIQRAGLHEQAEQQLQRLAALREVDSTIMNSMDLHTTLMILLGHVTGQLGVDAVDILLLRKGLSILEFAAGLGFRSKAVERSRLLLGEGYAGQAALERRMVVVADLNSDPSSHRRAVLLADESFIAMICVPLVAKGQVVGVLEVFHRGPLKPDADWLSFLETLSGQAAIAVADASLFTDLQRSNMEMLLAYDTTLEGWSAALDLRDKDTEGHSQRVTEMTLRLARALGVNEGELEHMRRGALLHDIGKMGIPDAILLKPGKLTEEEWIVMRQHPTHAYKLLSRIAFLRPALEIPYCHHEKWDGTGYPRKLKGRKFL